MGMDAELIAIGPYSPRLLGCLMYPVDYYADTPVGSTIIVRVACCATSDSSKGLAEALNIKPWAFEQHCDIDIFADEARLKAVDWLLLEDSICDGERAGAAIRKLAMYGFKFYYMPNG